MEMCVKPFFASASADARPPIPGVTCQSCIHEGEKGGFTRSCDYDVEVFVHLDGVKLPNFQYLFI